MGEGQRIRWRGLSESSTESQHTSTSGSACSNSTAPTMLSTSSSPSSSKSTKIRHRSPYPSSHALESTETIESWTPSEASLSESEDDLSSVKAPAQLPRRSEPDALPATSRDFAELFPSTRKLLIHHDDTTLDGNMNLRVDTPVTTSRGLSRDISLFHLRMYNLRCRDFSLRRYYRESGREICHCVRKNHKSILGARPNIQRSLSNALAAIKPRSETKKQQRQGQLIRHDSGYDSTQSDGEDEEDRPDSSHSNKAPTRHAADLVSLEFSNYAHVDLKRRGLKADKHYDFDYWGCGYSWQRSTQKLGKTREVSYHLTRRDGSLVARIVPEPMSEGESRREEDKGGWIPPSSLRILDKQINDDGLVDVADVVVSTGLIVLADDSIRRHFQHEESQGRGFHLPKISGRVDGKEKHPSAGRVESGEEKAHRKLIPHSL